MRKPPATIQQLATSLGVSARALQRMFERGCPRPRADERLSAWRRRAQTWRDRQMRARAAPRRPDDPDAAAALLRLRHVRARRALAALARRRRSLHSHADCAAQRAELLELVGGAFAPLSAQLAERLPAVRDPAELQALADLEVRAAFDDIQRSWPEEAPAPDGHAEATAADGPPQDASIAQQSAFWLAVWRNCRASEEELHEAVDKHHLHDRAACEAAVVHRCGEFVIEACALPSRWARSLLLATSDLVRSAVQVDVQRLLDWLERGFPEPAAADVGDDPSLAEPELDPESPLLEATPFAAAPGRNGTAHRGRGLT